MFFNDYAERLQTILKEHLESVEKTPEHRTMVTDGAYGSEENRQLAKSKNIELVTTPSVLPKAAEISRRFG